MLQGIRHSYRDARLRRALLRQSREWRELDALRRAAVEGSGGCRRDAWLRYGERRAELVDRAASIVFANTSLREVASDLGLSRIDVAHAYRRLIRFSRRPWALEPHHLPTALVLLPDWLEAVGALYLAGDLEKGVAGLEDALIAMDGTYPLSVIEPLVFSGRLIHTQTA